MQQEKTAADLLKDKLFYQHSDGGVTFSGGECLDQADFILECLKLCKAAGLHTAVDTSLDIDYKIVESIIPFCDFFLCDIKCISEELHVEGTGVRNSRIFENLSKLLDLIPEKIWIRIPVIPGFNANKNEMEKIQQWLAKQPATTRIELLPCNRFGESKFEALGIENKFILTIPSEEQMREFRNLFE